MRAFLASLTCNKLARDPFFVGRRSRERPGLLLLLHDRRSSASSTATPYRLQLRHCSGSGLDIQHSPTSNLPNLLPRTPCILSFTTVSGHTNLVSVYLCILGHCTFCILSLQYRQTSGPGLHPLLLGAKHGHRRMRDCQERAGS
jgi:hypothetical protein